MKILEQIHKHINYRGKKMIELIKEDEKAKVEDSNGLTVKRINIIFKILLKNIFHKDTS